MNDRSPVDLASLDPGEPPDLVRPAVRRFRGRGVTFTVVCILFTTALAAWATKSVVSYQHRFTIEDAMPHGMAALLLDARGNCTTPTYNVGEVQIALLDTAPMSGGRLALHFVVHGKGLSVRRDQPDGSSFRAMTTISPTEDPSGVAQVPVMPRATWGEAYVVAPASSGDRVSMAVTGPSFPKPASFSVDVPSLACR